MFKTHELAAAVRLHVLRDTRFHRTSVSCYLSGPLEAQTASTLSLLPSTLVRGTARLPRAEMLEREMAALFGARMGAGIGKSGDRQLLRFGLNLPTEKYAGAPVLAPGLRFLREMVTQPWLPDGHFSPDYLEQERSQLIGRIRATVNNKTRYAFLCGRDHLFRGEPAAVREEGTEEGVKAVTQELLLAGHRRVLRDFRVDLYVVGDVDEAQVLQVVGEELGELRDQERAPVALGPSLVAKGDGPMTRLFATEPMEQGWVILGLKSSVGMASERRWVLEALNGVLGGYPHSKLFANVREKASLAYQAASVADATKGAIIAYAGIDPANYGRATALMLEQIAAVARGEVTQEELQSTRDTMTTDLRLELDSPAYLIHTHFTAAGEGIYEDVPSSIAGVERVSLDQIVELAGELRADTLFFLSAMSEAELAKQA